MPNALGSQSDAHFGFYFAGEVLSLNQGSAMLFPKDHSLPTTDSCKGVFILSMKNLNTVKGLVIHLV